MTRDLPSRGPAVKRGVLDLTPMSEIGQRRRFGGRQVADISPAPRGTSIAEGRRMLRTLSLFFVASVAVACGGGDGSDLLGGDVTGTWRAVPNQADDDPPEPVEDRFTMEFAADGTYTETESGRVNSGTWSTADGQLSLTEDGDTEAFTLPYHAGATRMVFGALVPAGDVDGPFGSWTATLPDSNEEGERGEVTTTYEIRSDNTATISFDRTVDEDESYDGTWTRVGDDFRITVEPQENFTVNVHMSFADGLMGTLLEKI
jgi:hypothetical protein